MKRHFVLSKAIASSAVTGAGPMSMTAGGLVTDGKYFDDSTIDFAATPADDFDQG